MQSSYIAIANSKIMFIVCAIGISVITAQAALFIRRAYKRGQELGLEKDVMNKTMINSAIFSILPTLPILLMLLALTVPLGKYFPWFRLSVVGSAAYEGMAIKIAVNEAGFDDITSPGVMPETYVLVMWVMTLGIIWGILFNIFFMKHVDRFSKAAKEKQSKFIPIFSAAMFCGLLSTLSIPYVANIKNHTSLVSFVCAGVAVMLCTQLAKVSGKKVISDFSLPVALIVGMAAAVIYTQLVA